MPGTKRVPISRRSEQPQISPLAVSLFREMKRVSARCHCKPRDWQGEYWKHVPGSACDEWWSLHARLHAELRCKLWLWPCVQHPSATSPYPKGTAADRAWTPDLAAQRLWQLLEAASAPNRAA